MNLQRGEKGLTGMAEDYTRAGARPAPTGKGRGVYSMKNEERLTLNYYNYRCYTEHDFKQLMKCEKKHHEGVIDFKEFNKQASSHVLKIYKRKIKKFARIHLLPIRELVRIINRNGHMALKQEGLGRISI